MRHSSTLSSSLLLLIHFYSSFPLAYPFRFQRPFPVLLLAACTLETPPPPHAILIIDFSRLVSREVLR